MKILDSEISKYTLRKQQIDTYNIFVKNESKFDNFLLDIPVGSGKSLLAMLISKYYIDQSETTRIDLVTNSKLLQKQYTDEFKSITNLWGKSGYSCSTFPTSCEEGKDFAKLTKKKCENCPYDEAKKSYFFDRISMTNMHMFVTLHLYQAEYLKEKRENNDILIIDEAHLFEQIFSDYISLNISERIIKSLSFDDNETKIIMKNLHEINDISEFNSFLVNKFSKMLADKITTVGADIEAQGVKSVGRSIKLDKILETTKNNAYLKSIKYISLLKKMESKVIKFISDYAKNGLNWVLDINKANKSYSILVQTVWAREHLFENIFCKYKKIIFLSGTILDKELFCYVNGLAKEKSMYYSLPSSFPLKNRPIYYMPVGRMSYKDKAETLNKMPLWINKLVKKYNGKKGIIHTNSFELTNWIRDNIESDRFLYHTDGDREYMLQNHYTKDEDTIIVSPSMTTGVDLKDNFGRFNVLFKVPYPSLESNKNKARLKSNPEWYAYMTVLQIIQAYGRCVRSDVDYADFIILDSCFQDIMMRSSRFIPEYVQLAIKMVDMNK